ncbi:MAG: hypothetical protein L0Y70_00075, partial [Gemmataceae bacterium]|nr:hypothetical protein [Gemmataceae bacterium]
MKQQPLRKWFHPVRLFDSLMAFTESARSRVRELFGWPRASKLRRRSSNKPMFPRVLPYIEGLERREVPAQFRFLHSTLTVNEANTSVALTVELVGSATASMMIVQYETSDGTATYSTLYPDYTATQGFLTFSFSDTVKTFTVNINDDTLDEDDETFYVTLTAGLNAEIVGTNPATVTIQDNDSPPTVKFSEATSSELESVGTRIITAQLSTISGKDVTVPIALSGTATQGTLAQGKDYTIDFVNSITIPKYFQSKNISITVNQDTKYEDDETVVLTMGTPTNAALDASNTVHTATIVDDDNPPTVRLSMASDNVAEAAGSYTAYVTLSAPAGLTVTVGYATSDGTATQPWDYTQTYGLVTFNEDEFSKPVSIPIINDYLVEGNETFTLSLDDDPLPQNATLGSPSTGTYTIIDDDPIASLEFSSYSVYENARKVTLRVVLNSVAAQAYSVQYYTSNGTATAGLDYIGVTAGTVVFGAGDIAKPFDIWIIDDYIDELDETFSVTLFNFSQGLGQGSPISAVVTILDTSPPTGFLPKVQIRDRDPYHAQTWAVDLQNGNLYIDAAAAQFQQPWERETLHYYAGLVYNSETATPKPIVAVSIKSDVTEPVPIFIKARLTWGGVTQSWVTITPSGSNQPGDDYFFSLQVDSAVTQTGRYAWTVEFDVGFATHGPIWRAISDALTIVVNGATPFGHGWTLPDLNRLVDVGGHKIMIYGDGGTSFFVNNGGTYTGIKDDTNTLTHEPGTLTFASNEYTYTSRDQTRWIFDNTSDYKLLRVVDAHNLAVTYIYTLGKLTRVDNPNGNYVEFTYTSGLLSKIARFPVGVTVSYDTLIAYNGSNDVVNITDAESGLHTFTYNSDHKMTQ